MPSEDPVAEWRKRWTYSPSTMIQQPLHHARSGPRSPWVYAAAAFGGTIAAFVALGMLCVVGTILISARAGSLDSTPESLTYRNDTSDEVWIYECYERCDDYNWGFPIEPGDEESFRLAWYYDDEVEWVIITHEDYSYSCVHISNWRDQTIWISAAEPCPPDIHSPETNIA
jgi:hypothetical protein